MKQLVDIIVVNWNSGELLEKLMGSLDKLPDGQLVNEFIIVDNASTDNSLEIIKPDSHNFKVRIIKNEKNLGFSKACNLGAAGSQSEFLLFLNPDTWVYEGSLSKSVGFLQKDTKKAYGACGIQLVDHLNIPNRSCARIPSFKNFINASLGLNFISSAKFPGVLLKEWEHSSSRDIGHVIGAFYLVRTSVFQQLNGFDERFFLYYEDLDFSTMLHKHGYKIGYLSDVKAVHVGGGCSQKIKVKRLSYSYLSKIKYIYKHFPLYQSVPLTLIILTVEPIMRFTFYLLQASPKEAVISLLGYLQFVFQIFFSSPPKGSHAKGH